MFHPAFTLPVKHEKGRSNGMERPFVCPEGL